MWTKFTAAIEVKTPAGHRGARRGRAARLANLGRLADVSDAGRRRPRRSSEAILPNADGAVKFGGKYYAVPHYAIPLVLFYRPGHSRPRWARSRPIRGKDIHEGLREGQEGAACRTSRNGFPWNRTGDGYDPAMSLLCESYGAAWVDKSGKFIGHPEGRREWKRSRS